MVKRIVRRCFGASMSASNEIASARDWLDAVLGGVE